MGKTIKIAVVGTGIIGETHLEAIAKSTDCSLCALCDINEESAREQAEKYGVPYFTDYRRIAQETDADAVILNLPHFLHCEVSVFFLEHGMDVLVEKPMANSLAECDRMIAAAEANHRKLAVGHLQRFFSANRAVKALCESGELGKLCMVHENRSIDYFTPSRPRWFLDKEKAGGGIVMNYGAHALDKLFYITGHTEAEVFASVGNEKNNATVEGHGHIFLKFPDGLSASLTFSGYNNVGYGTTYYFTNGAAKVSGETLTLLKDGQWQRQELVTGQYMDRQLSEFCKFLRGEASEVATPAYSKNIIAVIEKIYG